jgi:hypothetical protein
MTKGNKPAHPVSFCAVLSIAIRGRSESLELRPWCD